MSETRDRDMPAFPQAVTLNDTGESYDSSEAGGTGLTKLEYAAIQIMSNNIEYYETGSIEAANNLFDEIEKQKENK